jgi:biopolymer transport protein TolR
MKVFVRGDASVAYGVVVSLMSFLQKNGVDKVGIVTESGDAN